MIHDIAYCNNDKCKVYADTTDDDCPFFHTNEFIENL